MIKKIETAKIKNIKNCTNMYTVIYIGITKNISIF